MTETDEFERPSA